MLISGHLLVVQSDGLCGLRPGTLRVHEEVIESIEWDEISDKADWGGPSYFISPGFVDAHTHLPQFNLIGAHGMPLLRWLNEVVFPSEALWSDVEYATNMTRWAARKMLSHGTTSMAAYATVHHDSALAAMKELASLGMRGLVGQVLMDQEAPAELCRPTEQLLDQASELQHRYHNPNSIRAAVTPRFAISCSEGLLQGAGKIASEHHAFVQTHLAETVAECDRITDLFDGRDSIDVYGSSGLLGERSLLGHGIHLSEPDRLQLSRSNSRVVHCPLANSFLGSGSMNRAKLIHDAVRISLGSDIGAGYEHSLVRVARAMIETASHVRLAGARGEVSDCELPGFELPDCEVPSAAEAWHSITAGNADAIGLSRSGRIEIGSIADLVIVRPTIPWQESPVNPLSMWMFAWDDRWIEAVLVRGALAFS